MALLTKVKAGAVSSLSDARYFSGMGVDWLGFDVNPASPHFVSLDLYKSIVGWVAGPKRVLELGDGMIHQAGELIQDYMPHAIEISLADFTKTKQLITVDILVRIDLSLPLPDLNSLTGASHFIVETSNPWQAKDLIGPLANIAPVLLRIAPDQEQVKKLIAELPLDGICLSGSPEMQVGVKEYGYADVLESLDVD